MNEELIYLVLSIVEEIPEGKVSYYSQIAEISNRPKNARLVGKILSHSEFWGEFPCHRVVHSDGSLVAGWDEQKQLLINEGITFLKNNKVNMSLHKWKYDEI